MRHNCALTYAYAKLKLCAGGCLSSLISLDPACRSVTDVAVQLLGTCVALVSVVASGMQQIICGDLQKRHNVTSNQLLSLAAPYQVQLHPLSH